MVPEFREGVLGFRDSEQTPSEDSVMWQLQNMFSHLQVRAGGFHRVSCNGSAAEATRLSCGTFTQGTTLNSNAGLVVREKLFGGCFCVCIPGFSRVATTCLKPSV